MTDQIQFPTDPEIPPTILNFPGAPQIGRLIWVDKAMQSEWDMEVYVRDEDLQRNLTARWRVVTAGETNPPYSQLDVPSGELYRDFMFKVQTNTLMMGKCHRLDLAVSGNFQSPKVFDLSPPIDAQGHTDVAEASWWILEGLGDANTSSDDKARLLDSCPDQDTSVLTSIGQPMGQ